jgi:hypothetical protein
MKYKIIGKKIDILTVKNNKGWSPIDILSYIPCYTPELFYVKLPFIAGIFNLLYHFYDTFDGDISKHKIVLTRYFIENYYMNIIQYKQNEKYFIFKGYYYNMPSVEKLLHILNEKISKYPESTTNMLYESYCDFNIHEYIHIFKKVSALSDINDLLVLENGFIEKNGDLDKIHKIKRTDIPSKIKCQPVLDERKRDNLFRIPTLIKKHILSDLNQFISKTTPGKSLLTDPILDKEIEKMYSLHNQDEIIRDPIDSKYLTYGKDYKRLYNKYKQKYIALKNKLQ